MSAVKAFHKSGKLSIYHADCRSVLHSLACQFDLFVTSPPYNKYEPGAAVKIPSRTGNWRSSRLTPENGCYDDALSYDDYLRLMRSVFAQAWAMIPDHGAICIVHKPRQMGGTLRMPTEAIPLPVRQEIIWDRGGGPNFNRMFFQPRHERIWLCAKPKFRLINRGVSGYGDVWRLPPATLTEHPCEFPVEIPRRLIEASGARSVCDPFMGSGTVLIAARQMGIRAVGMDVERRFCEMARARLGAAEAEGTDGTQGTHGGSQ